MLNLQVYMFLVIFLLSVSAVAEEKPAVKASDVFAEINGEIITAGQLAERMRVEYRRKFYHGRPPVEEVRAFQEGVAQLVVDEVLLLQEAERRKLVVDEAYRSEQFAARTAELTKEQLEERPEFIEKLKARIDAERLLEILENSVREEVKVPTRSDVVAYYEKYPEKFTTPSKDHVRIILLGVPAYAGSESWAEAREKATALLKEIREGADFAEMAMIHSSDESASSGGDMGYIHSGMLGGAGEQVVSIMSPGEISEPVMLLEGVAIFELVGRSEAVLNEFEVVQERAQGLLERDLRDGAWDGLVERLRSEGDVAVDQSLLARLSE